MDHAKDANEVRATTAVDQLLSIARQLIESGGDDVVGEQDVQKLASKLVGAYDNPFNDYGLRHLAAEAMIMMANRFPLALDCVIESAERYAETLKIDDADPYAPNSFVVLSHLVHREKALLFLRDTVVNRRGIAQWEARDALSRRTPGSLAGDCGGRGSHLPKLTHGHKGETV